MGMLLRRYHKYKKTVEKPKEVKEKPKKEE